MTPAEAVAIVAARHAAHATDRATALMQIEIIIAQDAKGDAAGTLLDVALKLVSVEARANAAQRELRHRQMTPTS
jgi:hypothetical protein